MKKLSETAQLNCSAANLWSILSDVGRCDWVPTIEKITLDGDCRVFEMAGMGTITEKILLKDDENMILQYSAIDTPAPIEHHLATMKIIPDGDFACFLEWTTEIEPEIFADSIHQGMLVSIEGIEKVL
ncbi:SRPBCC family protein [Gammaproteobacteria bacterium]|nr:SRPBCC family protein [Gammaproteobacteria bacterium]